MAMFEFKDSKKIDLERCSTTSETLVAGENVEGVTAKDCQAAVPISPKFVPVSRWRKALPIVAGAAWTIVAGVVVAIIASKLGYG